MNILFVVPYVPDLVRVRPYHLIRNLTLRGHKVTVATLWNSEADKKALEHLKTVCYQVIAEHSHPRQYLLPCLASLPTSKPLQAAYSWHPALAKEIARFINKNYTELDVVHVEHLRGSRYGLFIKSECNYIEKKIPIVWDSVDCISLLFSQASRKSKTTTSRLLTRFETKRTYHYEKELINQFDRTLVTSPVDKNAFDSMRSTKSDVPEISIIPNGVDINYFYPKDYEGRERSTLVLSGKMSYHANVNMALFLVQEVLPTVWSRNPDVKLWVVGKDPPKCIQNLTKNSKIQVTGTVDDIRPYLQNATIAVAPITYGAGIQNKVLEAMACGTPVIATSQAVSALSIRPGQEVLIADEPKKIADTILELLKNRIKQREIGKAGRRYVEENHDWNKIATELESIYVDVSSKNELSLF